MEQVVVIGNMSDELYYFYRRKNAKLNILLLTPMENISSSENQPIYQRWYKCIIWNKRELVEHTYKTHLNDFKKLRFSCELWRVPNYLTVKETLKSKNVSSILQNVVFE